MSQLPASVTSSPCLIPKWRYHTLTDQTEIGTNSCLSRLHSLKAQWASRRLEIPDDWIGENSVERQLTYAFQADISVPVIKALCRIRHMISPLSLSAQESRSSNYADPEPDFLAAISPDREFGDGEGTPFKESVFMDNLRHFRRLRSLLKFPDLIVPTDPRGTPGLIVRQLSHFLQGLPGFFLREHVSNGFSPPSDGSEAQSSVDLALLIRQYGSKPEISWEWAHPGPYDPPIWRQNRAIACAMHISPTHPAVMIIDRESNDLSNPTDTSFPRGNMEPALQRLALQAEPSLVAILKTWEWRQRQRGGSAEPPPWLIVFGLLITGNAVTIVAHFPNPSGILVKSGSGEVKRGSSNLFCSCVVDKIPFHPEVRWTERGGAEGWEGPMADEDWISDRLRLSVALLTLVKNSNLVSAIWDDIDWPQEVMEAEDALEKHHAQWHRPTPSPSKKDEDEDEDESKILERIAREVEQDNMETDVSSDDEEKVEREQAVIEASRPRILEWRSKIPRNSE